MKNLKKLLNFTEPAAKLDEHDLFARQFSRTLTIMGYESYDVWVIAEKMLEMALNPSDFPETFLPQQRKLVKKYPSV